MLPDQHQERCTLKSSTLNHTNPHLLGAEKRFDALVKKEMMEHQHLISSHNKEMQDLRELVKLSVQRFDSLTEHYQTEIKDLSLYLNQQILFLRGKIVSNEAMISEQKQTIESLHHQLNEFHETYASKIGVEKFKNDLDISIKANTINHINSFQELQRELNTSINRVEENLVKSMCDTELTISDLDKKIESNFYISRIDKDAVLKEVRIYEKTIFIIEKKIENIYTLLERLNKRFDVCHKQE